MLGNNMFAYCRNNPVNRIDISGWSDSPIAEQLDDDVEIETTLPTAGGTPINSSGTGTVGQVTGGGSGSSGGIQLTPAPSGANMTVVGAPEGEKTEVHHIVEQCQIRKSGFTRENIQGTNNKVEIPRSVHRKISGYYSSKTELSGDLRIRDWLAGKSFEFQYEFGMRILEQMWKEVFGE